MTTIPYGPDLRTYLRYRQNTFRWPALWSFKNVQEEHGTHTPFVSFSFVFFFYILIFIYSLYLSHHFLEGQDSSPPLPWKQRFPVWSTGKEGKKGESTSCFTAIFCFCF